MRPGIRRQVAHKLVDVYKRQGVLWGPAESFLVAVNKSGEDVATAAETAQQAALQAIADMQ